MTVLHKSFEHDKYIVIYRVEEEHNGLRLDQYLMTHFLTLSRQFVKSKIKAGDIKIHDRPYPHRPSVKVYTGEKIEIITYKSNYEDEYWRGELIEQQVPEVIFEDDHIIVISKPPYMTTHPAGKHLFYCATVQMEIHTGMHIRSVHRLDRETSGVLILAKTETAASAIAPLFELRKMKKAYIFLAHKNKNATPFPFTANESMQRDDNFIPKNMMHCYPYNSGIGKTAKTDFQLVQDFGDYVLALAFPLTGRQHQIRAHAAFHGYPLVGDKLYNGDPSIFQRFKDQIPTPEDHDTMQMARQALHATGIKIPQTTVNPPTIYTAPLPLDFTQWIAKNYTDHDLEELNKSIKDMVHKYLKL